MVKKSFIWGVIVLCVLLLSVLIVVITKFPIPSHGNISDGLAAIVSAFIGIVITMAITAILLDAQSASESKKEILVKQYDRKQCAFQRFLENLSETIISLTDDNLRGNNKTPYANFVKLEELISQLGYLRSHMNDTTFCEITNKVTELFTIYNEIKIYNTYKCEILDQNLQKSVKLNSDLYVLASKLSESLFSIATTLHDELYIDTSDESHESNAQNIKESLKRLLNACGLRIESENFTKE